MSAARPPARGRGAVSNASGRYESYSREDFDDGWTDLDEAPAPLRTTLTAEKARVIIARNESPDVGFDRSINPYRGCEHGCIYCFARPTHAYMGLSPGLDFESRLFFKPEAARLLERELAKPSYVPEMIHMGANTDPYQPQERRLRITRQVLEVLQRHQHPVSVLTKSALVAWMARLAPGGRRVALAHRTDGSSYEAPTRWVAHEAIKVEPHIHAVDRSRELCARAFGYARPLDMRFGLLAHTEVAPVGELPCVVLVHGTSRADKCWPDGHWAELGLRLIEVGYRLALPHGNDAERQRSEQLARALGSRASVWPRLELGALTDRLATCAGVVGVDSGLSHIAVALDLPHVQIYNFDTAWRTGPQGQARQISGAQR